MLLGNDPLFKVPQYQLVSPAEFLVYAVLGLIGGLLSVAFTKSLLKLRERFLRLPRKTMWFQPAIGGVGVGMQVHGGIHGGDKVGVGMPVGIQVGGGAGVGVHVGGTARLDRVEVRHGGHGPPNDAPRNIPVWISSQARPRATLMQAVTGRQPGRLPLSGGPALSLAAH